MKKEEKKSKDWISYYENHDLLREITYDPVDLSLTKGLANDIRSTKRKRKLKNVTIKLDPLQIIAIKKLSTMKSMPYQTLIRHWLAEGIKQEMDSVAK
ncbi:MAG: hypothetical protein WAL98_14270 [Desulfatiglandaceae bacterium]